MTTLQKINACVSLPELHKVVTDHFLANADLYAGFEADLLTDRPAVVAQVTSMLEADDYEAAAIFVAFLEMQFSLTEPA